MPAGTIETGRDTWCVDELKPGRTARGVQLVAQRCFHRLITPRGDLLGSEDEANFGLDLAAFVGSNEDREIAAMLPVRIRNELLKDPMVDSVAVRATRVASPGGVKWMVTVSVVAGEGPFELLVSVDEVTVELLGVR